MHRRRGPAQRRFRYRPAPEMTSAIRPSRDSWRQSASCYSPATSNVEIREVSMIHAKHIRFLAFLFSLALFVPFAAFGQSSNGAINGNVGDASGSALPGVTVTATNVGTAATRPPVTNGTGHYEVPLLMPGTYRVNGELSGFQPV